MIPRNRRGLHVVKPSANPADEEKATAGVNVKQVMLIGAITALTGTVVGAVGSEIYRYFRSKVPIPPPGQQNAGSIAPNPTMPWMQPHPLTQLPQMAMPQASPYALPPAPQYAVQQMGAFPQPQVAQNPYPQMMALPAPPAVQEPAFSRDAEPLSRPELAQWQRRLESWQRELERRETYDRDR
jgi:hypothetical protein